MVKKIVIGILGMGMLFSQQSCIGNTPDKTTKEPGMERICQSSRLYPHESVVVSR